MQSTVGKVFSPIGDFFGGITRYRKVRDENTRLRRELEEARGDAIRGADAVRERQLLNALQRLEFAGDLRGVTARVVSNSPSNFQLTVTVDHGTEDGIATGMPVVTAAGLVGRIAEVSKDRATVLLLTDPASSVGVRLAGTGDVGIVTGSGRRDVLPLSLVSVETKVAEGEAVVTSGLQQGLFPPQIPVGRVRGPRSPPAGWSRRSPSNRWSTSTAWRSSASSSGNQPPRPERPVSVTHVVVRATEIVTGSRADDRLRQPRRPSLGGMSWFAVPAALAAAAGRR